MIRRIPFQKLFKKPRVSPRFLHSQTSQQTGSLGNLPEIELVPCNIHDELTPEEIAIMKADLASGVRYKLDVDAWNKADQPIDMDPFLRVYRNGLLTDEKVPRHDEDI
eukprot:TRINITY_DN4202_c0_g1_i1.p1 TRINITY_DN4202_c0_g1~~TRINITY_DN4202_c0_g1_i1.p1  ORF type:complete len:108 (-),score=8.17 TRINITY_DN4202_c0_g1_i1:85-408(-)